MNNEKINKFENPARLAELDSKNMLIRAGFEENMILCDIGAGTGVFSFSAAEISTNEVYALEKSDNMIEILNMKQNQLNIGNLNIKKVDSDVLPLMDKICDMAVMVTVLHELENKDFMISEIKRILKENGKLLIIEFHKRKTPMGPPVDHRISEEQVEEICIRNGLKIKKKLSIGDNFYGTVFEL